ECAADVAAAQARRAAIEPAGPPTQDVSGVAARARGTVAAEMAAGGRPPAASAVQPAVEIAVVATPDLAEPLRTTLGALGGGASGRVWLLGRDWTAAQLEDLASGLPAADVRQVVCDEVPPGAEALLLPDLLPEVRRVLLLPPTAAVLGNIRTLADADLEGRPVAARTTTGTATARSGFGLLYRAAGRLHTDAAAAADLYQRIPARHR